MFSLNQSDRDKLERLVEEMIKLGKWQDNGTPSYGILEFNIRLGFLTEEVLSLSGLDRELRRLRTSRRREIVERALGSIRKRGVVNAESILQVLSDEVDTVRKESTRCYTVAWPVAVSLPIARDTSEIVRIDGKESVLLDFVSFGQRYLPRKMVEGTEVVETKTLIDAGIDVRAGLVGSGASFLAIDIYARDSWYAALESGISLDLFFSVADLSSGITLLERYPLSQYPNPSVCFIFTEPHAMPETRGKSRTSESPMPFAFRLDRFREVVRALKSIEETDVWPTIRRSLVAFRRAMCQESQYETLVNFWTACEVAVACEDRIIRDDGAAKRMEKIFQRTWYEFPAQVHEFLHARNAILHEGSYDVQWHHIFFANFLFENLLAVLIGYATKGKSIVDIRTIFEAARLSEEERKRFHDALQELTGTPETKSLVQ